MPSGVLWRIDRRITVSFYIVSVVLIVAIFFGFSLVYRDNFQSFVERLTYLLEVDTNVLADRVSPYLAHMGAHQILTTVVPSEIPTIGAPVSVENPDLALLREQVLALEGRINNVSIVRGSNEQDSFLYFLAQLDESPLLTRQIGASNMFGTDYFVLRYESAAGPEHRFVAFEKLDQTREPKIAELVAFVGSRDLKPLTLSDSDRDSEVRGGAYSFDGQTFLLVRIGITSPSSSTLPSRLARHDQPVSLALGSNDAGRESYSIPEIENSDTICRVLSRLRPFSVPQSIDEAYVRIGERSCEIPLEKSTAGASPDTDLRAGLFKRSHLHMIRKDKQSSNGAFERPDSVVASVPMPVANASNAELHAARGYSSIVDVWRQYSDFQIVSFSVPMLGIALLVLMFDFAVIRRIRRLAKESTTHTGPVFTSAEIKTPDEIGQLARRIAAITGKLERQKEMLEQTAQHIRHDIKAPLDRLEQLVADNRAREVLNAARRVVDEVVEDQEIQRDVEPVSIVKFLSIWCANAQSELNVDDILFVDPGRDIWVRANNEGLEDTLEQLLMNARDFREQGTPISLSIQSSGSTIQVVFNNEGEQIAEPDLERVFSYSYSTRVRSAGEHLGLGLYQARRYMSAMGGGLSVRNWERGVEFIIELQRTSSQGS